MYSVVTIARNEEQRLPLALASVRGAPELVVLDSGSDDATLDIAEEFGARVSTCGWRDDFGWARDLAARAAANAWLVTLDADERFSARDGDVHGSWLRVLGDADRKGANIVLVMRHYLPGVDFWHPVAWRNGAFRWEGLLHERLVALGERIPLATDDLCLLHQPGKARRHYCAASRRAATQRPKDAWLVFHEGREHALAGDLVGCEAPLRRAAFMTSLGALERSEAAWMLAIAARARGDVEACIGWARDARELFPRREPALTAVGALLEVGRTSEARRWLEGAARVPVPRVSQRSGRSAVPYLVDRRFYSPRVLSSLARAVNA